MSTLLRQFDVDVHGAALLRRGRERELLITTGHRVLAQDLRDGSLRAVAAGYDMPAGVVASADGETLYVADLDPAGGRFTLYRVPVAARGEKARKGTAVLRAPGVPGQLALSGTHLFYADAATGDLVRVDVAGGRERELDLRSLVHEVPVRGRVPARAGAAGAARPEVPIDGLRRLPVRSRRAVIAAGLTDPSGVCVSADGSRVYVAERSTGRIVSCATDGEPGLTVERLGVAAPEHLTIDAKGREVLVAVRDRVGAVEAWDLRGGAVERLASFGFADHPLAAWRVGRTVVTVDARGIRWWDVLGHLRRHVTLHLPHPEPFIGSFQRVTVDLGTSGLAFDDLEFRLPDGDAAGRVSYSRDALSGPNEIMLLVGYRPGKHTLEAANRTTGTVVATVDFEITDRWADPAASPAQWLMGELASFQTGYTWGGGPTTPQNVDVFPQSGARSVAILMVDVSDARYPTGAGIDAVRTAFRDAAVGAAAPSAKTYYEEVSHTGFTLALQGASLPLVSLSGAWSDYFSTMPAPWPGTSYQPVDNHAFAQACVSAAADQTDGSGNPLVDFSQVQSLILVVRSKGAGGGDDFFWAQAWGGAFTIPGGSVNLSVLGMPDDWDPTRGGGRTVCETLCHELGHNLGYPDLYTNVASWNYSPDVQSRDISDYDLMSAEGELPHMTIAQKMETGWVRPEWIQLFDFSRSTIPLSQTVTLHAVEAGAPPTGAYTGVEIRIADGWNYYFEYRKGQTAQIGDQELALNPATDTADGVVVGTDVQSLNFTGPIARPQIIRLRPDSDGEHSFFGAGQDYDERDHSSMAIADFRLTVLSTNGNTAQVKVEYGTNGRPDLYIRPWPGGTDWQSPDIEVRNARANADPANWRNVPWIGHANDVVARFRNRGPVTCRNVTVDFFIKDFTVSNAPETWIGSQTQDVPPEATTAFVEFTTQWVPPSDGHRCIIARTDLYVDTSVNPNIVELSDANNTAQSNYSRYISASASPATREISAVTLTNPYPVRAEIYVVPQIVGVFSDLYRLYLEHSSLTLDPGESRPVQVMVESLYGDPHAAALWERKGEKVFFEPTTVSLTGYAIPPDGPHHPVVLGGAQLSVSSARATRFTGFEGKPRDGQLGGRVEVVGTGGPASGFVLLTFHGPDETADNTVRVPLDARGAFWFGGGYELVRKFRADRVSAHYPGRPGFAPCDAPTELPV